MKHLISRCKIPPFHPQGRRSQVGWHSEKSIKMCDLNWHLTEELIIIPLWWDIWEPGFPMLLFFMRKMSLTTKYIWCLRTWELRLLIPFLIHRIKWIKSFQVSLAWTDMLGNNLYLPADVINWSPTSRESCNSGSPSWVPASRTAVTPCRPRVPATPLFTQHLTYTWMYSEASTELSSEISYTSEYVFYKMSVQTKWGG